MGFVRFTAGNEEGREVDDEGGGPYVSGAAFCCLSLLYIVEMGSGERIVGRMRM